MSWFLTVVFIRQIFKSNIIKIVDFSQHNIQRPNIKKSQYFQLQIQLSNISGIYPTFDRKFLLEFAYIFVETYELIG